MAFWGKNQWEDRGASSGVVHPWRPEAVEEAGYRLRVGREIFTNNKEDQSARTLEDGETFVVGPGQFLYVLTEETVSIPLDCIGFISARASIKFQGLVNVSGFQVDPGYCGKLIFAMFNAGPRHIHLRQGEEIFSIWVSDLVDKIPSDFVGTNQIPDGLDSIPSSVLNKISGKALTAYQVNEALERLKSDLDELKKEKEDLKIKLGDLRSIWSSTREKVVYISVIVGAALLVASVIFGPTIRAALFSSEPTIPESNVGETSDTVDG